LYSSLELRICTLMPSRLLPAHRLCLVSRRAAQAGLYIPYQPADTNATDLPDLIEPHDAAR
jgi:hypothetical protein